MNGSAFTMGLLLRQRGSHAMGFRTRNAVTAKMTVLLTCVAMALVYNIFRPPTTLSVSSTSTALHGRHLMSWDSLTSIGDDDDDAWNKTSYNCTADGEWSDYRRLNWNTTIGSNITECEIPPDRQCEFVQCVDACGSDEGFIQYLQIPYCTFNGSVPAGMVLMILWIFVLFIALGTTAEDFFCPALSVISDTLSLSDNVAGVTFLAFGNGAPDIFSVITSISNSPGNEGASLALGSLAGAGIFVTTVVVGLVAYTVPFKLTRRPFLRDVATYLTATTMTLIVLADGKIDIYESLGMVGIYVIYVIVVIVGRKIYQSGKQRRLDRVASKQANARQEELKTVQPSVPQLVVEEDDADVRAMTKILGDSKEVAAYGSLQMGTGPSNTNAIARNLSLNPDLLDAKLDTIMRVRTNSFRDTNRARSGSTRSRSNSNRSRSGSIKGLSNRPNHHPTTASIAVTKAAHAFESKMLKQGDKGRADVYEDYDFEDEYESLELLNSSMLQEFEDQQMDLIPGGRSAMLREKVDPLKQFADAVNPFAETFFEDRFYWKIFAIVRAPIYVSLVLTIPVVDFEEEGQRWCRPLNSLHLLLCPLFIVLGLNFAFIEVGALGYPVWAIATSFGIFMACVVGAMTDSDRPPKFHAAYAYLGFLVSIVWIYCVANEIVNVLQAIGQILHLSDAILGLTVLAWGNSIGDCVSNLTVAKQGFPRMAVGACFGGPALNMLLGIGIACSLAMFKRKTDHYIVRQEFGLIVSVIFLLTSLLTSLIFVPLSGFSVGKKYGITMFCLYALSLASGLYIEFAKPQDHF
eukprot:m.121796 g.121796  ORF g.121796 m.121796 type:complete len:803 (+) comp28879_c0_seq2:256-2664(+)